MNKAIRIEKNTVQETLVIPLYGRKLCTERSRFLRSTHTRSAEPT